MTKLLDTAIELVRRLPPDAQDHVARTMLETMRPADANVALTADERLAVERSMCAARRGEFASDEEVAAVWAKYGL